MLLAGLTFLLTGCGSNEFPAGTGPAASTRPASSIVFQSESLAACSGGCCIRTQFVNTNDGPVDVMINWDAFDPQGQPIATLLHAVSDVGAGATSMSTSPPFGNSTTGNPITACSQITRFERGTVLVFAE
jgi:hypothetical protein